MDLVHLGMHCWRHIAAWYIDSAQRLRPQAMGHFHKHQVGARAGFLETLHLLPIRGIVAGADCSCFLLLLAGFVAFPAHD